MPERIDHHPARRDAQIEAARIVLRGPSDTCSLRHACEVLLALSGDPLDRVLAREVLRSLDP